MWPDQSATSDLLKSARAGDADAVNHLLELHRDELRKAIHFRLDRRLARRIDASDIVQDVMLEASRRLPEYLNDPRIPFPLWLRQLAKDSLIDMQRRHRHAQRRSLDREQPLHAPQFGDRSSFDLAAQVRDLELTPAADAIRRELHQRFLAALDELNDDDREIVLLRHVDQLDNGQAASLLGLSPAAAGMRYLRALRKLRAVLGESPSMS